MTEMPMGAVMILFFVVFVVFVVCSMVAQYFWILSVDEKPDRWNQTLTIYKNMIRVAVFLPTGFFFLATTVFLMDWSLYPHADHFGLIEGLEHHINRYGGSLIILFTTFFSGVIRLFVERAADEDSKILQNLKETFQSFTRNSALRGKTTQNDIVGTLSKGGGDSWFAWFCFSLVLTGIVGFYSALSAEVSTIDSVTSDPVANAELLAAALVFVLTLSAGYFCWIYMIVFHKLTDEHHFSGRTARVFMGGVFRAELPRQAILIGPPAGGKSSFKMGEQVTQTSTSVSMRYLPLGNHDDVATVLDAAIIDAPGENMGDHIILSSTFRADTLVFIIDAGWLDPDALTETFNYQLVNWFKLISRRAGQSGEIEDAEAYFRGFYFATKRDGALIPPEDIFKVRSFVLYLNNKGQTEDSDKIAKSINAGALDNLTIEIGQRFGADSDSCCWFIGNSVAANESVQLIGMSTANRKLVRDRMIEK